MWLWLWLLVAYPLMGVIVTMCNTLLFLVIGIKPQLVDVVGVMLFWPITIKAYFRTFIWCKIFITDLTFYII